MKKPIGLALAPTCSRGAPRIAATADERHMLDQCRAYAASHLRVDAGIINVK